MLLSWHEELSSKCSSRYAAATLLPYNKGAVKFRPLNCPSAVLCGHRGGSVALKARIFFFFYPGVARLLDVEKDRWLVLVAMAQIRTSLGRRHASN